MRGIQMLLTGNEPVLAYERLDKPDLDIGVKRLCEKGHDPLRIPPDCAFGSNPLHHCQCVTQFFKPCRIVMLHEGDVRHYQQALILQRRIINFPDSG